MAKTPKAPRTKAVGKKKASKAPNKGKKTQAKQSKQGAKKKISSKKKVGNKKQDDKRSTKPKKSSNVVYKDSTGLTSDDDSEFSSESEGEWDDRTTDSQGNKRIRQTHISRYFV